MSTTNSKTGKRPDLPHFVRSSWEANVARYYRWKGINYKYEPETFYFNKWYKRGAIHYTPDFYLPEEDLYIEVKGRMTSKDRTKLKRMEKHYPHIKIHVLDKKEYTALEKKYGKLIPNWEFPEKKDRNAHKEKVEKSIKELADNDWHVAKDVTHDNVDFIAFRADTIRFIKVHYIDKGEEYLDSLKDFESLSQILVPPDCHVLRELWVYEYGKKGYKQHII